MPNNEELLKPLGAAAFDPRSYEGKPRHFKGEGRALLDSFITPLTERVNAMANAELVDLRSACQQVSPSNCWCFTYAMASILYDMADGEISTRVEARARAAA